MRTTALPLLLACALGLVVADVVEAQKGTPQPGPKPPGTPTAGGTSRRTRLPGIVAVGERAPDFELDASNDRPLKLSRTRGDWVLLVFGDRKEDMLGYVNIQPRMRTLGVQILTVCNEKAHNLRAYVQRAEVPFLMLADVTGEVSAMYGLYDYLTQATLPGYLILDREGMVRLAILGQQLPPDQVGGLVEYVLTDERASE